jgi:predicted DNA-binding transcriptional regulator AlpA
MNEARPYRLVRERDLPAYAGLKRTQISELIKRGEFPRPIKLSEGGRAKAWLEDELLIWQRQRLAKRDIDWGFSLWQRPSRDNLTPPRFGDRGP